MSSLLLNHTRRDFPILTAKTPSGKPIAYLDNAASSQKPQAVIDAVATYYAEQHANVHRGMHRLAELATTAYESARRKTASFIHAASEREIIFTRGTTESINLVAHGWARPNLKSGDRILLTRLEHHSNIVPWQLAAQETGAEIHYVPVLADGTLDRDVFTRLLDQRVKLVALTHVSNVLGTVNPVRSLIAEAKAAGAKVLIDAAQSAPHLPLDVQDLQPDWIAFSGHKMCGPTGIGVLWAPEIQLESMQPFQGGGEMIDTVSDATSTWAALPYKFEAGTPNIAGAVGLGAAIDYLQGLGMDNVKRATIELSQQLVSRLRGMDGVQIFGQLDARSGVVSFAVDDIHPHDLAQCLDQEGVAIRAGHLCCQPLMRELAVPAVARASVYFYNELAELDCLVDAIGMTRKIFGYGSA